jgi:hypothetical protein
MKSLEEIYEKKTNKRAKSYMVGKGSYYSDGFVNFLKARIAWLESNCTMKDCDRKNTCKNYSSGSCNNNDMQVCISCSYCDYIKK